MSADGSLPAAREAKLFPRQRTEPKCLATFRQIPGLFSTAAGNSLRQLTESRCLPTSPQIPGHSSREAQLFSRQRTEAECLATSGQIPGHFPTAAYRAELSADLPPDPGVFFHGSLTFPTAAYRGAVSAAHLSD